MTLLFFPAPAVADERLCGWLNAYTTYPDWTKDYTMFLQDAKGTHTLDYEGGDVPDLSSYEVNKGEYIPDRSIKAMYYEGWSAYFCACVDAIEEDGRSISKFKNLRLQKLDICRKDPSIEYATPFR